ncbi:AraC family transcriptional regulator [Cohnella sp. GCM10020058]|uniref:AraC family transcriptional regulator n=1 Tax=Cohnella sp. GCM10020058 TaxID=3317330 RepID=UPI003636516F
MDERQLDELLRGYDEVERIQKSTGRHFSELDGSELRIETDGVPRLASAPFFPGGGSVSIYKHHRFAEMVPHKHEFLELNFMYAGSCRQHVAGRPLTLREGELCLLGRDATHRIDELGDDDILINILIQKEALSAFYGQRLRGGGLVERFIGRELSDNRTHERFIVFRTAARDRLRALILNMLREYYDRDEYALDMLHHYVPLLFLELMRVRSEDIQCESEQTPGDGELAGALSYLSMHYRVCTLGELASRYGYSPDYLGRLLKRHTGCTFGELVQTYRLNRAAELLRTTALDAAEIARQCGYESHGFFYRKFKSRFGMTPSAYRRSQT